MYRRNLNPMCTRSPLENGSHVHAGRGKQGMPWFLATQPRGMAVHGEQGPGYLFEWNWPMVSKELTWQPHANVPGCVPSRVCKCQWTLTSHPIPTRPCPNVLGCAPCLVCKCQWTSTFQPNLPQPHPNVLRCGQSLCFQVTPPNKEYIIQTGSKRLCAHVMWIWHTKSIKISCEHIWSRFCVRWWSGECQARSLVSTRDPDFKVRAAKSGLRVRSKSACAVDLLTTWNDMAECVHRVCAQTCAIHWRFRFAARLLSLRAPKVISMVSKHIHEFHWGWNFHYGIHYPGIGTKQLQSLNMHIALSQVLSWNLHLYQHHLISFNHRKKHDPALAFCSASMYSTDKIAQNCGFLEILFQDFAFCRAPLGQLEIIGHPLSWLPHYKMQISWGTKWFFVFLWMGSTCRVLDKMQTASSSTTWNTCTEYSYWAWLHFVVVLINLVFHCFPFCAPLWLDTVFCSLASRAGRII